MSTTTTMNRPPVMAPPTMSADERKAVAKLTGRAAGGTKVHAFFESNKASLGQLLPKHMTPERFLRVAMNARHCRRHGGVLRRGADRSPVRDRLS